MTLGELSPRPVRGQAFLNGLELGHCMKEVFQTLAHVPVPTHQRDLQINILVLSWADPILLFVAIDLLGVLLLDGECFLSYHGRDRSQYSSDLKIAWNPDALKILYVTLVTLCHIDFKSWSCRSFINSICFVIMT